MSLSEERLKEAASKFDPTKSKVKPIRAQCISTYLAMADEGLISLEPGEYEFYTLRLRRLTQRHERPERATRQHT